MFYPDGGLLTAFLKNPRLCQLMLQFVVLLHAKPGLASQYQVPSQPPPGPQNSTKPGNPTPPAPPVTPIAPIPPAHRSPLPPGPPGGVESSANSSIPFVRGHDAFYGGAGIDFATRLDERKIADENRGEQKYALGLHGIAGWGPVQINNFFAYLHYIYTHDWSTDDAQSETFVNKWRGNPQMKTFILPTRELVRTHEFAGDIRYADNRSYAGLFFTVGLFGRLSCARQGSRVFGEPNERTETIALGENLVPYVQVRYYKNFYSQISIPFRTTIDRIDPTMTNATYSWSSRGRGRVFSVVMNNELNLTSVSSVLRFSPYYYMLKYSSITNDYNRLGFSMVFDFPVLFGLRAAAKLARWEDKYFLKKIRLPNGPKEGYNDQAKEFLRNDVTYALGASAYFDIDKQGTHRLFFDFSQLQTNSTIQEFGSNKNNMFYGYAWAWPSNSTVERRTNRFTEGPYAEKL